MSKRTVILAGELQRRTAAQYLAEAPTGWHVTFRPPTRSLDQNARMWAMLGDVSEQVDWYGKKLTRDNWKDVFSAALKAQEVVPGIDGNYVILGQRTSQMTIREMSDLMELMSAFGSERGVNWSEPAAREQPPALPRKKSLGQTEEQTA